MNRYLIIKIGLSLILMSSVIVRLNYIVLHHRWTILDVLYFSISLINLMIIWIKRPFFWYCGLFIFSLGIYYAIRFEFFDDSNSIPSIMSTKPLYYYFIEFQATKGIANLMYYFPYVAYFIFLILFLSTCQIRRYYKISCPIEKVSDEFLDEKI